jgi:uncharacterized protein RhaS with RHS repeats
MYMRNRYYDPQSGQFTQPDPIGLAGGLNAYGFAAGDPVSYADPYGLCLLFWLKRCRERSSRGTAGDAAHYLYHLNRVDDPRNNYFHGRVLHALGEVRERGIGHAVRLRRDLRWDSDQAEGFAHIYWSCSLSQELGEEEGRHSANAHEQQARHGDPKQDEDERVDRANNERGFRAARENPGASCYAMAKNSVQSGDYDQRNY